MGPARRRLGVLLAAAVLTGGLASTQAVAGPSAPAPSACGPRVLVLAAMPLELNPLLAEADIDPAKTVRIEGRTFYSGRLGATDVVLAMTRIGMVNARQTATVAFEHATCPFTGAVFSGVAGSRFNIGDVAVPRRWTSDGGKTWTPVDRGMYQTARRLRDKVDMTETVPVGDAACLCPGVDAGTPVTMPHETRFRVGGGGTSGDTYGGHALPCIPGGGDVFGCEPCLGRDGTAQDALDFAANAPSLADPAFFSDFFQPPESTTDSMSSQDQETAAVAEVARRYGVPFLGIRAVSDGEGDPLHLPGFPWQFFAYRQLAGNNAAIATIAFLERWAATGYVTGAQA